MTDPEGWHQVDALVDLPVLPGVNGELWRTLVELCSVRPGTWTLVGGQMVLLHALEDGRKPPRVSQDLDVVVNARVLSGSIAAFVTAIEALEFTLAGASPDNLAHRYRRGSASIDVLAPEGLGPRADLTTTPPGHTLEVPGGTQALARTELLPVRFEGVSGLVPRPSLLGAIIIKALAVQVDDVPEAQRQDLVMLLSLVADPVAMAEGMSAKDHRRLRTRSELLDVDHHAWRTLEPGDRDRGLATLRLLTR